MIAFHTRSPLLAFDVAHGFYDGAVAHTHEVNSPYGIALSFAPPVSPANDRSLTCHKNFLKVETRLSCCREPLPDSQACLASNMPRTVRGGLRVFDDAVLGN